jgi:hypothetical protein
MSVALGLTPYCSEVTGVEDDPGGGYRVFVGARYRGIYFVPFPGDEDVAVNAWRGSYSSHLIIDERDAVLGPPHATLPGHDVGYHERNRIR